MQEELHDRFGIDLRQNWAFGFIRRASLPVLGVVAAIGWLLTGMQEQPIASRGIYDASASRSMSGIRGCTGDCPGRWREPSKLKMASCTSSRPMLRASPRGNRT